MNRVSIQGWIAVGICTLLSSVWAFWGAFESFHEGWYFKSLGDNLFLTFKYFALAILFTAFSVIPLRRPKIGATLYLLFTIAFYLHVEAPDETGHEGIAEKKIRAIGEFDRHIVGEMLRYQEEIGDLRILIVPDHATPLEIRTHSSEPVPFAICGPGFNTGTTAVFSEAAAKQR